MARPKPKADREHAREECGGDDPFAMFGCVHVAELDRILPELTSDTKLVFKRATGLQFVFSFGVEKLMRAVVVGCGHEHLGEPVQVAVIGRLGIHKFLRRGDAVFFQHHHQHLGVDHRTGIKKFHREN